jgi:hypothetical protein
MEFCEEMKHLRFCGETYGITHFTELSQFIAIGPVCLIERGEGEVINIYRI